MSAGVLRLDHQVVSRRKVGGASSSQLIPAQMYLKVDEDVAGTLERKRNYIHCLIVRIMKQEKEMHIDNLVFKVTPPRPATGWRQPLSAGPREQE